MLTGLLMKAWLGLGENQLFERRDLSPTTALESVLADAVAEHLRLDPKLTMARLFSDRTAAPLSGIVRA